MRCRGGWWRTVDGRGASRCWSSPEDEIFLLLHFVLKGFLAPLKLKSFYILPRKVFWAELLAPPTCGTHRPPSATPLLSWDHIQACSKRELVKRNPSLFLKSPLSGIHLSQIHTLSGAKSLQHCLCLQGSSTKPWNCGAKVLILISSIQF